MTKHIHGGDVYKYDHCLDFSANCNPLGTPQSVKPSACRSFKMEAGAFEAIVLLLNSMSFSARISSLV